MVEKYSTTYSNVLICVRHFVFFVSFFVFLSSCLFVFFFSFLLFVSLSFFLSFCLFAFLSFCLDIMLIKCLKGLKSQKSFFVSKFQSGRDDDQG